MKILVFSDTHGNYEKMREIILSHSQNTELIIHLGDLYDDVLKIRDEFPRIAFLGVRGNCDYIENPAFPQSNSITLENCTFFFTHGHMQLVKNKNYSYLLAEAKLKGAKVALFGHTHISYLSEHNGITLFNPGSLSLPRDYCVGSYGIINVKDGKCEFNIVKL